MNQKVGLKSGNASSLLFVPTTSSFLIVNLNIFFKYFIVEKKRYYLWNIMLQVCVLSRYHARLN